ARLGNVAPGALAALDVDPLAGARDVNDAVTGAWTGPDIDIGGHGARCRLRGGQEYHHRRGGHGDTGGEVEKLLASLTMHDEVPPARHCRPRTSGATHSAAQPIVCNSTNGVDARRVPAMSGKTAFLDLPPAPAMREEHQSRTWLNAG